MTKNLDQKKVNYGLPTSEGRKYDANKLRWDLLPYKELEEVAEIFTFGAAKYGDENWREVPDFRKRYLAALLRHVVAYAQCKELDEESNKKHLAHAVANCLFLMWKDNGKYNNDNL